MAGNSSSLLGLCISGPGQVVTWIQLQSRGAISSARRPPAPSEGSLLYLCSHTSLMKHSSVPGETSQDIEPRGNHYSSIWSSVRVRGRDKQERERDREREQGFIERDWILRIILIIKHIQLSLYLTVRVWVWVPVFIGFYLLFVQCVYVFMCLCALWGPVQLSGLVCRWPSWGLLNEIPLFFPLSLYLSLFPFLSSRLLSSPLQLLFFLLLGFIYQ